MSKTTIQDVRYAWADASIALWASVIREEAGDHLDLLRENGWSWAIDVDEDYCGHTHAVAGRHIGDHLHPSMCVDVELRPDIRRRTVPSTIRLAGKGPKGSAPEPDFEHPAPRHIDKGDLVTVGDGPWGSHIVMAISKPNRKGRFETIEGNSTGKRGDSTIGRGVVRKYRSTQDVKRVHRIKREHIRGKF